MLLSDSSDGDGAVAVWAEGSVPRMLTADAGWARGQGAGGAPPGTGDGTITTGSPGVWWLRM